jgi:hypothetical protein
MMRVEHIGDASRITAIYALCEWPSWQPRYVGKTVQFLHERHKAHIRDANSGRQLPVHYWLRKKIAAGERLAIKIVRGNNRFCSRRCANARHKGRSLFDA